MLATLLCEFLLTHLNYGCNIFGFTEENLKKMIYYRRNASESWVMLIHFLLNLKFLKVRKVIKLQHLQLLYGFLNKSLSTVLNSLFELNSRVHRYLLRQLFHIPRISSSTYGNKSIKFHCPELWNSIFKNRIIIDNNLKHNVNLIRFIVSINSNVYFFIITY